jgi:DNA-binding GntR family transcriptional regulator
VAPPSDAEIHDHLVAALLDQRLLPGTKLVEDKLGQVYGVSRTRIRQVLIRLAQAQLVTLQPNRGACVAQPSVAASREVFEVRQLIEPTLLQRAIGRASADDLRGLADQIAQEEQARRDGQQALALRLSGEFHLMLARLADHGTLERLLRELVSRTALVLMSYGSQRPVPPVAPGRWVDACNCRDHRGLLAAMRGRDVAGAQRLMQRHLQALEDSLCFDPPGAPETDLVALLRGPAAG